MPLTLRLFAALRESLGTDRLTTPLRDGDTPAVVLRRLLDERGAAWTGPLMYAVNERYADADTALSDGDEIAFIPPLGGGAADARVALGPAPLELARVVDRVTAPQRGGLVTFTGLVRDHFDGRAVQRLEYEAYEPMALRELSALCDDIEARWPGTAVSMEHRLGLLEIGDTAVVIAVAGAHRGEAFEACRYAIDQLKIRVPIFKKEVYADGSTWKANHDA